MYFVVNVNVEVTILGYVCYSIRAVRFSVKIKHVSRPSFIINLNMYFELFFSV